MSTVTPPRMPMGMSYGRGKTTTYKRHQKVLRDTIRGITKSDIRRLARRGGVLRISSTIYEDTRQVLRTRLTLIVEHLARIVDHCNRKTVTIQDVVFVLKRLGNPIYGFDPVSYGLRSH